MLYFGYRALNKKPLEAKKQEQRQTQKKEFVVMINCKFAKLSPEALRIISVGDKEKDSAGNLIGEIISLEEPSPYIGEFEIGLNRKLIKVSPELQQIKATLKIITTIKEKNIFYKDKPILENGTLEFSSERYSLEAEDISIVEDSQTKVTSVASKPGF
jgi:hypothetical protein